MLDENRAASVRCFSVAASCWSACCDGVSWGGPLVPPELIHGNVPTAPTKLNDSIPQPVQRGEAVVPTINPKAVIDRVLVGYKLNQERRDKLMAMLQTAGLEDRVEFESTP